MKTQKLDKTNTTNYSEATKLIYLQLPSIISSNVKDYIKKTKITDCCNT